MQLEVGDELFLGKAERENGFTVQVPCVHAHQHVWRRHKADVQPVKLPDARA